MKSLHLPLIIGLALILTNWGCYSVVGRASELTIISNNPPYEKFVVSESIDFPGHGGWGGGVVPEGEYKPLYEDEDSYYFVAPTKVHKKGTLLDIERGLYEGGISIGKEKII